jgi:DNA-binding NarL/FixJ family response regulator
LSSGIRIVIAEDNYLVREGMRRLLEETGEVQVLGAVGTAAELVDAVVRMHPDAVITDIRMPPGHQMEGIAAAHEIRERHPGVGVVVLSQHVAGAYAFELLKNGTSGLAYLLKDRVADPDQLLRALREVVAGRSVIDPQVVEALVQRSGRLRASPLHELSKRELEVLSEMAQGKTNAAIGMTLHLSESAVEKYVSAIFLKLGLTEENHLHRRVGAVLAFLRDEAAERRP